MRKKKFNIDSFIQGAMLGYIMFNPQFRERIKEQIKKYEEKHKGDNVQ